MRRSQLLNSNYFNLFSVTVFFLIVRAALSALTPYESED